MIMILLSSFISMGGGDHACEFLTKLEPSLHNNDI